LAILPLSEKKDIFLLGGAHLASKKSPKRDKINLKKDKKGYLISALF
jgi:hypothetical protein